MRRIALTVDVFFLLVFVVIWIAAIVSGSIKLNIETQRKALACIFLKDHVRVGVFSLHPLSRYLSVETHVYALEYSESGRSQDDGTFDLDWFTPGTGSPYESLVIHASCPYWVAVGALSIAPLSTLGVYRSRSRRRREKRGLCGKCGYDLQGNSSGLCPECGTPTKGVANMTGSELSQQIGV